MAARAMERPARGAWLQRPLLARSDARGAQMRGSNSRGGWRSGATVRPTSGAAVVNRPTGAAMAVEVAGARLAATLVFAGGVGLGRGARLERVVGAEGNPQQQRGDRKLNQHHRQKHPPDPRVHRLSMLLRAKRHTRWRATDPGAGCRCRARVAQSSRDRPDARWRGLPPERARRCRVGAAHDNRELLGADDLPDRARGDRVPGLVHSGSRVGRAQSHSTLRPHGRGLLIALLIQDTWHGVLM